MIKKILIGLVSLVVVLSIVTALFMQQKSFGKLPSGERLERLKKSKQYKNGIFENTHKTKLIADDASYFGMIGKFFSKGVDREPVKDLPSVKTNLKTLVAEKPTLVWFGHSSFLININGKKILSDPVFSDRPSPVQYAGSKSYPGTRIYGFNDFPELDVVVISHDHYDHLDYNTILALKDQTKLFCVPIGVGEHLQHWGVPVEKIKEFDWWEGDTVAEGVELTCTPARHFSGRGFKRNGTLWASYVLKSGGYTIFIGGDSGYDDYFKEVGNKFGPFDLAMLECGQYDPQWPDIHMMPEQMVQASIDLKAKVTLPVHWGKFTLALHPWKDPIKRATTHAEKLNVKLTTPLIGEPIYLDGTFPSTKWWDRY
jgi:L-ascorbate metabolism protein UlaG (beta-lactamase superfamily)